ETDTAMPLLLIPLLIAGFVAVWALLLPLALLQRYRRGKARRRAQGWMVKGNAALLALSVCLFVFSAWIGSRWIDAALWYACIGLGMGVVIGVAGLWLSRFEVTEQGLYYTPNRWLVLTLTTLVAARIALGLWQLWRRWHASDAAGWQLLNDHASLFALGGLLLGYYLAYTFGLRGRIARLRR
ncbi:MAG: DUF1453 domain-containing protein, partial [Luteimonas sp.]